MNAEREFCIGRNIVMSTMKYDPKKEKRNEKSESASRSILKWKLGTSQKMTLMKKFQTLMIERMKNLKQFQHQLDDLVR